jgi:glycerate kinase
LKRRLAGADLCVTGEGRLDEGSLAGKTVVGVARLCRDAGVPCVALVGSVGPGAERVMGEGLTAYFAIGEGEATAASMQAAPRLLARAARNLPRFGRRHRLS